MTQRRLFPLASLPPAQSKPRGGARPYRRGSRAERELVRELYIDGGLCIRSAGSAGPYDVCVVLPNGGRLLQVKLCGAPPTDHQIAVWLEAMPPVPPGWSSELWVRTPRGWRSVVKGRAA